MAEQRPGRRSSNSQLLQELDALSQTLYQSHTTRRTASLALPRSASPTINPILAPIVTDVPVISNKPRSRRMSMSPFRSRRKSHDLSETDDNEADRHRSSIGLPAPFAATTKEKKGIWGWKPLRALAHIGMQRMGCLFSVEVVAVQGLPASMNGLRMSVAVRKKETKDGALQTMPARVFQGSADFEETLFVRCHVYCSGKPPKFEPHPFVISAVAIDAPELDFGRSTVDLSSMVKESMERNSEGVRVRQWDATFPLAGKAKGGEMVVKLGFQIMEDGGVGIYKQEGGRSSKKQAGDSPSSLSTIARRQSKSSFSVASPKITRSEPSRTPMIKETVTMDLRGIDEFNLDESEPSPPPPSIQKVEPGQKQEDLDLPEFEVIDKGIEVQEGKEEEEVAEAESESAIDEASVSSEIVKEVVHDSAHLTRLTELDAIAKQIKALESLMSIDDSSIKTDQEDSNKQLNADEETVTREFLQMLELEDGEELRFSSLDFTTPTRAEVRDRGDGESKCYLSDLGKGLSTVVQTRDGGYLIAMNPFNTEVSRKEPPKLAMQLSKPFIINDQNLGGGIEVFQKLTAIGPEELCSKLDSLAEMDELTGKTAEQIAFEGIASAIISGRSTEGASSTAAKSVAALKILSLAMSHRRKERISTGIWNVKEEPLLVEEILAFSLQKVEAMAMEALKIQAEVTDEEPPFDVSPLVGASTPLNSAMLIDEWLKSSDSAPAVAILVVVQLRDPLRRYETVGAPMVAVIQASRVEEERFKVGSLHVGGVKMGVGPGRGRRSWWDPERGRLTAMQWMVVYGMGKEGRRKRRVMGKGKGGEEKVWSVSSRVMADMWMKTTRNPDVKLPEKL